MKSAFELAMERLGGNIRQYSDEQKEQLAEVDRLYESKIAQAKFAAADRLKKASNDSAQQEQIQNDLAVELRSLEEQRERKKEELRKQFNG
ncbi:MAG: hypothetical protein GX945_16100 [Lentisphaerae bacterium]|jgi:DNA-binding transcriptional MerR regulator|nr:hypothetical protein [Lentisphaerota bacterium]